ncbi:MAG TPA: DUF1330 domain-containing protein [Acidimicrobiales bacterium]|jgi:uncharacterized protein (DUF1330 family)|nr:DUF1330 domain-containing protein [Acidimicrobiales bacterium]
MSIVPTHEQLHGFLGLPDDGPVVMLNLLKFKAGGGSDEYGRYGDSAVRMVEERGGRVIWMGRAEHLLIGEDTEGDWDAVALVEYPSKKDFIEMTSSSSYQDAHKHREAGLERTVLLACRTR